MKQKLILIHNFIYYNKYQSVKYPTAKCYPVDVDRTRLEVVAIKASDGSIGTAFNTCQVWYDSGKGYYEQQGDLLVC